MMRLMTRKILMSNQTPWDEIKTPQSDLTVRQIKGPKHLTLYWGKDVSGCCMFILELEGDHAETYCKNTVSVYGIKTDLRHLNTTGNQGLVITLEKHVDQDLFFSFCNTLISALTEVVDPAVGLSVALTQIKRWKTFLSGRKAKVLTPEEVRGLFSELLFVKDMIAHGFSEMDTLEAWQGPEASHQDFIYSNIAVEIKSLSGRERNTVRISSEDQLEGINDNLFLRIYRLVDLSDSDKSISLNEMVKMLEEKMQDPDALEILYEKLGKVGYVELREYDNPKFIVAEEKTYLVTSDFPRLIRSEIPDGIVRVGYEIELEMVRAFECGADLVWR